MKKNILHNAGFVGRVSLDIHASELAPVVERSVYFNNCINFAEFME